MTLLAESTLPFAFISWASVISVVASPWKPTAVMFPFVPIEPMILSSTADCCELKLAR